MANSKKNSGYSGQKHAGYGYEYVGSVTGCSCFRLLSFGGAVEGHHFLLQERGVGPQKDIFVLEKFKNFTSKIGELCHHMKFTKKRPNQFQYSPETHALNFSNEHEQDENGDLLHSFSSRFASRPLIDDQQRRIAAL